MCVSAFQDYCNISKYVFDGGDYSLEADIRNDDIEIRGLVHAKDVDGETYLRYYRTDLKDMKKLAKTGNEYAKNHLKQ